MNRMMAIIEREMRKFFRSPALMMASMIFPLVQLIVLGNAFGGKIREAKMGVVDEDHGTQAIRIKEAFDAVRANAGTFVAADCTGGGGAVSVYRVHEVSSAGIDHAGDVRVGHDRRRDAVYRRQGT